jgi:hypothetical protein
MIKYYLKSLFGKLSDFIDFANLNSNGIQVGVSW